MRAPQGERKAEVNGMGHPQGTGQAGAGPWPLSSSSCSLLTSRAQGFSHRFSQPGSPAQPASGQRPHSPAWPPGTSGAARPSPGPRGLRVSPRRLDTVRNAAPERAEMRRKPSSITRTLRGEGGRKGLGVGTPPELVTSSLSIPSPPRPLGASARTRKSSKSRF